ncbi:MAG: hypothetical protein D9V44_00435 [Actinobacteria bacterium]|nr:MAG: hypothetical protein D9V44_00435 [Actinomycetota bacterium]
MASLCKYAATCPVFTTALGPLPHIGLRYRRAYCRGGWGECARFKVAEAAGRAAVPAGLLPNELQAVRELVTAP